MFTNKWSQCTLTSALLFQHIITCSGCKLSGVLTVHRNTKQKTSPLKYRLSTVSFPKYVPPTFCTLLWAKSGEGVFAQMFARILVLSRLYAPPLFLIQLWQLPRLSGWTAALINVYYRKSAALVLKLSQEASKQLALSVVINRGQPHISSANSKNLGCGQRMGL